MFSFCTIVSSSVVNVSLVLLTQGYIVFSGGENRTLSLLQNTCELLHILYIVKFIHFIFRP